MHRLGWSSTFYWFGTSSRLSKVNEINFRPCFYEEQVRWLDNVFICSVFTYSQWTLKICDSQWYLKTDILGSLLIKLLLLKWKTSNYKYLNKKEATINQVSIFGIILLLVKTIRNTQTSKAKIKKLGVKKSSRKFVFQKCHIATIKTELRRDVVVIQRHTERNCGKDQVWMGGGVWKWSQNREV